MKTQELNYIKTTISWLLENGDFEDSETSYNTAMNSIDILEEAISVTRCCKSDSELLLAYTEFLRKELHLNISDTWIESYKKNSK